MEAESKYWICHTCATQQGLGLPERNVTFILGICGHCNEQVTQSLTPVVDFSDPKTGREPIID